MNTQAIRTARILGWGGILPFTVWPLAIWLDGPDWLDSLSIAYGVVILAFMAGTLWLRHLLIEQMKTAMLVASNLLALLAWPAVLLPLHWAAAWLTLLFAAHLVLDEPWRSYGHPGWYRRLRLGLSSSVIALLLLSALIGFGRVL